MFKGLTRDMRTIVIAVVAASLVSGVPAAAAIVANAHKVDGKHAVGAGASKAFRSGKLVATNRRGNLPNNIIVKAPNAQKVGGKTARALMSKAKVYTAPEQSVTGWRAFFLPSQPAGEYKVSYTAYFDGAAGSASDPVQGSCYLATQSDTRIATETADDIGFGSYAGVHGSAVLRIGQGELAALICGAERPYAEVTWHTGNNLSVTIEPLDIVTRADLSATGALSSVQKKQLQR